MKKEIFLTLWIWISSTVSESSCATSIIVSCWPLFPHVAVIVMNRCNHLHWRKYLHVSTLLPRSIKVYICITPYSDILMLRAFLHTPNSRFQKHLGSGKCSWSDECHQEEVQSSALLCHWFSASMEFRCHSKCGISACFGGSWQLAVYTLLFA